MWPLMQDLSHRPGKSEALFASELQRCDAPTEARELPEEGGVDLPEPALALLYERTQEWAAGLRLAALSLAGHAYPGRVAAEFSGSERTVAPECAEPDCAVLIFLLHPAPGPLKRHAGRGTAHASPISDIPGLLSGHGPAPSPAGAQPLLEPLTDSEARVLRYLPTNLSAREIAEELYLSVSTIRTHTRHLFAKLGVHRRTEAVNRARAVGLLPPSPRRP